MEAGFDLILLDPPTFSNSARAEEDLDLQRDHGALLDASLALLSDAADAQLLFVCHARRFQLRWTPPEGWRIDEITHQTLDEDCSRGRPAHRAWRLSRA